MDLVDDARTTDSGDDAMDFPRPPSHRPAAPASPPGRPTWAGRALLALLVCVASLPASTTGSVKAEEQGPDYERIEEVLEVIEEHFVDVEALDRENLTRGAIRGIVDALGDEGHTTYLTPEELKIEQDSLQGHVVGIGVVVDQRARDAHVIGVVDGSPADVAGIQAGDVIVTVDGVETTRLPIDDVAALVRGDVGTSVRLGIERPGASERLEVQVVRADIEIEPASWALVPGSDVAVMRVVQFSAGSAAAARRVLADVLETGADGLVLDLRGNPGGLVDEARAVAAALMEDGVLYRERNREGRVRDVRVGRTDSLAPDLPLVVLVDYGTASSAEILAAALRDNGRARIVGQQTYGTGTVLHTFELGDGSALRIAVRDWLTPSGDAVFRIGVRPDREVVLPAGVGALQPADLLAMTAAEFGAAEDAQLRAAVADLEAVMLSL